MNIPEISVNPLRGGQTWVRSCFGFCFMKPKHLMSKLRLRLQLRDFKNSNPLIPPLIINNDRSLIMGGEGSPNSRYQIKFQVYPKTVLYYRPHTFNAFMFMCTAFTLTCVPFMTMWQTLLLYNNPPEGAGVIGVTQGSFLKCFFRKIDG